MGITRDKSTFESWIRYYAEDKVEHRALASLLGDRESYLLEDYGPPLQGMREFSGLGPGRMKNMLLDRLHLISQTASLDSYKQGFMGSAAGIPCTVIARSPCSMWLRVVFLEGAAAWVNNEAVRSWSKFETRYSTPDMRRVRDLPVSLRGYKTPRKTTALDWETEEVCRLGDAVDAGLSQIQALLPESLPVDWSFVRLRMHRQIRLVAKLKIVSDSAELGDSDGAGDASD